ncbi:MAG: hypothetical protein ACOX2G_11715 [Bacillota bacterium]
MRIGWRAWPLKERYSQEKLEAKDPKEVSEEFYKLKVHALNTTSLLHGNESKEEE